MFSLLGLAPRGTLLDLMQSIVRGVNRVLEMRVLESSSLLNLMSNLSICSVDEGNSQVVLHTCEHAPLCCQVVKVAGKVGDESGRSRKHEPCKMVDIRQEVEGCLMRRQELRGPSVRAG